MKTPDRFSGLGAVLFVLAFAVITIFVFGAMVLRRGDPNTEVNLLSLSPLAAAAITALQLWFVGGCGVVGLMGTYLITRGRGPFWPVIAGAVAGVVAGLWLLTPVLPPPPPLD